MAEINQSYVDQLVSRAAAKKNIFGAVLCIEKGDDSLSLISGAGNLNANTPYFIASVTKLYVTAVLMKLKSENRLHLNDKISKYISQDILDGLHVRKGVDYSKEITVKQLMANTSGIPDYFTGAAVAELIKGKDQCWDFDRVMNAAKKRRAKFPPGQKAQYSDTNYRLLGRMIETITNENISTVFKEYIFEPLHLKETYVYDDPTDLRPAPLYVKNNELHLPKYMASVGSEGGIVSTAKETMTFLKAFMNGRFFPQEDFSQLMDWKLLFRPGVFYYGVGLTSQPMSSKDLKGGGLIGHWGQSGAFAFYHEPSDLYFSGTINQFYGQRTAALMMNKILKQIK
ncbi:serine hydrolase domain-containing protein [Halobacillus massiliensis]|uniref:serine hydrolase domain-containing protein n=1 Tax=Halobacillus massiliensis TaxID=1926286 RepID=UPI0009E5BC37|nr:serine hydrolase domain-containing protein [Halobacillus massiliensis]